MCWGEGAFAFVLTVSSIAGSEESYEDESEEEEEENVKVAPWMGDGGRIAVGKWRWLCWEMSLNQPCHSVWGQSRGSSPYSGAVRGVMLVGHWTSVILIDFQIFGEQGMAFLYEIFCVWFNITPMIDSSISSNILINIQF